MGMKFLFGGEYTKPEPARNDKGFDYRQYLKSIGMVGSVSAKNVQVNKKNQGNILEALACHTQKGIEGQVRKKLKNQAHQDVLLGILLGNDDGLEDDVKENFRNSSLSHILAVSGMHVAYLIAIVNYIGGKCKVGKRNQKMILILLLGFFMLLTNRTPSVRRACVMAILAMVAILVCRKSDILNNMAISLFLILIQNPFAICNIGLILSYSATLGIVLLSPIFISKSSKNTWQANLIQKVKSLIIVSVSAWVSILPISMICFQSVSFTFLVSNLMVSVLMGMIMMLGIFISIPISIPFLAEILSLLLSLLLWVSEFVSNLPFSHILVCSPNMGMVVFYFIVLATWIYTKKLGRKSL